MSNESQDKTGQLSYTARNLDSALIEAREQLQAVERRRKDLIKVIRDLSDLKQKKMPSELFTDLATQN